VLLLARLSAISRNHWHRAMHLHIHVHLRIRNDRMILQIERVDSVSKQRFEEVVAAFEMNVPAADFVKLAQLGASRAAAQEIEEAVRSMVGDLEFVRFAKLDQGPLVSLLGKPKKMTVYLIGNPVLANRMYEQNPAVGLYAPLRVSIYDDYNGTTHFTYDRPSTLLAQFDDEKIRAAAEMLDDKLKTLASRLA